jgi:hypothetical protein
MRKLILVTAIALMATAPCYANLSLASAAPAADAQPTATAKPEAVKPETAKVEAPKPDHGSRPRRHRLTAAFVIRQIREHCH